MKTAKGLIKWFLQTFGYKAITLPPFGIYALEGQESNEWLSRHENTHWDQYKRMGFIKFYVMYLWYNLRFGYYNNPMEVEARAAENR